MRPDMHNLLVERGHAGRWHRRRKGTSAKRGRCRGEDADEPSIARPYRPSLSENLAPLVRFVRSAVGRPWNDVYSEIRSGLDRSSTVQKHVLDHLGHLVERHAWIAEDGRPWRVGHRGPEPVVATLWRDGFYVCPRTGLVRASPPRHKRQKPAPSTDAIAIEPGHEYRRLAGLWFEVWWGVPPGAPSTTLAIVRKRSLSRREKRDLGLSS